MVDEIHLEVFFINVPVQSLDQPAGVNLAIRPIAKQTLLYVGDLVFANVSVLVVNPALVCVFCFPVTLVRCHLLNTRSTECDGVELD